MQCWKMASGSAGVITEQEPGGVNLAEKVTNFDMVSDDLHIQVSKEMNVCRTPAGGCAWGGQKYI